MVMMVFVYVMMDLHGRKFGSFVPLVIFRRLMLLRVVVVVVVVVAAACVVVVVVAVADDDGGGIVNACDVGGPAMLLMPIASRRLAVRALLLLTFVDTDVFAVTVQPLLLLLTALGHGVFGPFAMMMVMRRDVRHRFEIVRAPSHFGRRFRLDGRWRRRRRRWRWCSDRRVRLTALRPRPVITAIGLVQ